MRNKRHRYGFTIVELLIVVVVIAILAAIIIVAYNGISQRSKNAVYQADTQTILKKLNLFYSQNSRYPTVSDVEMSDQSSPTGLPSNVNLVYTDVGLGSMRNGIETTTTTYTHFTIGTYINTLYVNSNTGVKTYVAKPCLDINSNTIGLLVFYPDIINNVNQIGSSAKYMGVGNTVNCVATP